MCGRLTVINGTHHISLSTADLDRLLSFYCDLLGLPLLSRGLVEAGSLPGFERVVGAPEARVWVAQVCAGNLRLEVFAYQQPHPAAGERKLPWDVGIRHIAFDVTDIDGEYQRLQSAGVEFLSAPQTIDVAGVRSVYLRDPDDNIVELQEVLSASAVDRSHVRAPSTTAH